MNQKAKHITVIAMLTALLCVLAPPAIPIGAVPISMATFVVYLMAATFGWKRATPAVLIYLLLGLVGVPVFTGWEGGFQKIVGVTGGYLIGYLPCAFLVGFFTEKFRGKVWVMLLSMVVGTAALYALGTAWFCLQTATGVGAALAVCVLPFLPGDALKIVAAAALSLVLRRRLKRIIAS